MSPPRKAAAYSPSEWRRDISRLVDSMPSAFTPPIAAIDVAISAGCAFWVSVARPRHLPNQRPQLFAS